MSSGLEVVMATEAEAQAFKVGHRHLILTLDTPRPDRKKFSGINH